MGQKLCMMPQDNEGEDVTGQGTMQTRNYNKIEKWREIRDPNEPSIDVIEIFDVDGYRVIKKISDGSWSKVYLCEKRNSQYALKLIINQNGISRELVRTNIQLEQQINSKLKQIQYQEILESPFRTYVIMDFNNYGTLKYQISDHRTKFAYNDIRSIVSQLIHILNEIHLMGYVFNNLNPDQVLITQNYQVKLIGFRRCTKPKQVQDIPPCSEYNLNYQAPEIDQGINNEFSSDFWSLGALLYYIVLGVAPYRKFSTEAIIEEKKKLLDLPNTLDFNLRQFIQSLQSYDPKQRLTLWQIKSHPFMTPIETQTPEETAQLITLEQNNLRASHIKIDKYNENTLGASYMKIKSEL